MRGNYKMTDTTLLSCKTESGSEARLLDKLLKLRTIIISGEINKTIADRISRHLLLMEDESDEPITVIIDSPGGDADAGFAIFDMLRFVKPEIRTICCGLTASAGSLILLAAKPKNRMSMPNARILIHQPLGGAYGSATEILIQTEQIVKLRARINEVIAEETGQPLDKVTIDTDRDCWMTPTEAKEYGLIDRIITNRDDLS
jgi:ATP-dependent Clp protease protease subunit